MNSMNLICKDPCQYTYFSSRSKSKIDYFWFDPTLEEFISNINFYEEVIGADHLPGLL